MKPKSLKSLVEQLRARQALLDGFVQIKNYSSYTELADLIESGQIFKEEYGEKL